MSEETALVPSETRTVDFYGDPITGALVPITGDEPRIYVPIRPICEALGLSWGSQRNRLYRDEVLREAVRAGDVEAIGQRPFRLRGVEIERRHHAIPRGFVRHGIEDRIERE